MASEKETRTLQTVSLLAIATVAAAAALVYTRTVMIPFVLALLLSYLIHPLVDWLQDRLKMPRWAAILLTLLLVLAVIGGLGVVIASSVAGMSDNAQMYNQRLIAMTDDLTAWLDQRGIDVGQQDLAGAVKKLPLFDWIRQTAGGVFDFVANFFLVLIFIVYLIARRSPPPSGQAADLQGKVRSYLTAKIILSAATGLTVGLILLVLGVDLALVFGLLAFLLNFIPNIGSVIATLLPLPVVLIQFDSALMILLAILLPGAVQMTIGNVIEPRVLGKSVDLNPVTVLLGLMFWGLIWGVVGMLLATPLTAVLKVQLNRFEVTRPVAKLMGSRDTAAPV
jgi:AI-2 transport protein TqsA